ncbi:ABC transporter permease [Ferriphaselus sp. R-1]|uniref:ABC transporter permease n=1 Tax=Ferriphaselus sp. R-1 TaxID=1485544 RepID=UPI000B496BEE|nr:ABC transporter permease [Ferriphaselus sp. R-1]
MDASTRKRLAFGIGSFLLPLLIWSLVSYAPFIWHPKVMVTESGGVDYFQIGMLVDKEMFATEVENMRQAQQALPAGTPANPIYLPAPHEVAQALYRGLFEPLQQTDTLSMPASLWHSIQIIFWGFLISSLIGVPLGVLAGTYVPVGRLAEPFIEFFRYLPAPAFGALAVAILGIYDGPKIAIIVIGTLFQQVLIVANTTRKLEPTLIEAARTLGTRRLQLLSRVVVPGILPDLYRDQRILLGWAWTYLIVAELIGTSSGITWYITQQARYQHFDNVYAGIMVIGLIGFVSDLLLARLSKTLFPWDRSQERR